MSLRKFFSLVLVVGATFLLISKELKAEESNEQEVFDLGEIVVTATKTEKPIEEVVNNITVITSNKIENKNSLTLQDLIKDVSGVDSTNTGSFGSATSIFLRGSEARHTQILIDGVKLQDAISIDRSLDSAHILISNFERVEVLKGTQSVLYGSDAIGGVVNIITNKEKRDISLLLENGSFNSSKIDFQIQDKIKEFNYNLSLLRFTTDGYSSADEKEGNKEKDGYDNTTYSVNIQHKNTLGFLLHKTEAKTEVDGWDWINNKAVDAEEVSFTSTKIFSPYLHYQIFPNFTQNIRYSKVENIRDDMLTSWPDIYLSKVERFEWQNNYRIKNNDFVFGYEREKEEGSSNFFAEKEAKTSSYYLQNQIKSKNFIINTGVRHIKHSKFGRENVFKSSFGYLIDSLGLRIKTNYSTGFNAPSLFQLFDQYYGEPNLKPEESKSFDIGFDEKFKNKIYLDLTCFNNKFDNLVQYNNITWKYENIGRAKTSGIETDIVFNLNKRLILNTQYTLTNTKNEITGRELLKRPKNKFSVGLKYDFKSGSLNVYNLHIGKRKDFPYVELPSYNKTDLTLLYNIEDNQIIVKIENLFDKYYQESKGYGTAGRSFYIGVRKKVDFTK